MDIVHLADRPAAVATLAEWYFDEWGRNVPGRTLDDIRASLQDYLNRDRIPLVLLGVEAGQVVAAAELKFHEMDIYPDKAHWLGGVFVAPGHRGRAIGARLVEAVVARARALGVTTLHLQTERLDGGLYMRLGWQPVEQTRYRGLDVLVMERHLGA